MKKKYLFQKAGQTAVEYLLLLGVVVAIVLVGFQKYLPRTYQASNLYFNKIADGISGKATRCGDGTCGVGETQETCCVDCGVGICNWGP